MERCCSSSTTIGSTDSKTDTISPVVPIASGSTDWWDWADCFSTRELSSSMADTIDWSLPDDCSRNRTLVNDTDEWERSDVSPWPVRCSVNSRFPVATKSIRICVHRLSRFLDERLLLLCQIDSDSLLTVIGQIQFGDWIRRMKGGRHWRYRRMNIQMMNTILAENEYFQFLQS